MRATTTVLDVMNETMPFKKRLERIIILAVLFGASFGAVVASARVLSPWSRVLRTFDVVLVSEGCQFSQAAASCLEHAHPSANEHPHAVAVPTTMVGEHSRRMCRQVRSALDAQGELLSLVSLEISSEEQWCQRLAEDGREWLVANQGIERWPAFVHDGTLVGVGLRAENFTAVGEPEVSARLDECADAFMAQSRAR